MVAGEAGDADTALALLQAAPVRRGAAGHPHAGPRRPAPGGRAAGAAAAAGGGVRHRARRACAAGLRAGGRGLPDQTRAPRPPAGCAAAREAAPAPGGRAAARRPGAGRQRPRPRAAPAPRRGAVPEGRTEVRHAAHRRAQLRARRDADRTGAAPGRRLHPHPPQRAGGAPRHPRTATARRAEARGLGRARGAAGRMAGRLAAPGGGGAGGAGRRLCRGA